MIRSTVFLFAAVLLLGSTLPYGASAQLPAGVGVSGNAPLTIEVFPRAPQAGGRVVLEAVSYVTNLKQANIAWYIDGVLRAGGPAQRSIAITLPEVGREVTIQVVVETQNGEELTAQTNIISSDVVVVWEGQTYIPPLHKGKPLPSAESRIVLEAFPNFLDQSGNPIPREELVYEWVVAGRELGDFSGLSQYTAFFTPKRILEDAEVELTVRTQDGTQATRRVVEIPISGALVVLYERDPLLGVRYETALRELSITAEEVTLLAEPYYTSASNRSDSELSYEWTINRFREANSTVPTLTLRPTGEGSGRSMISAQVSHATAILQSALREIVVLFGS